MNKLIVSISLFFLLSTQIHYAYLFIQHENFRCFASILRLFPDLNHLLSTIHPSRLSVFPFSNTCHTQSSTHLKPSQEKGPHPSFSRRYRVFLRMVAQFQVRFQFLCSHTRFSRGAVENPQLQVKTHQVHALCPNCFKRRALNELMMRDMARAIKESPR